MFHRDLVDVDSYMRHFRRLEFIEPEKKLMFALLEDALFCMEKYLLANCRGNKRYYLETEGWLFNSDEKYVFSFEYVCETLGLEPSCVRRGVLNWKRQSVKRAASYIDGKDALPGVPPTFAFKRALGDKP